MSNDITLFTRNVSNTSPSITTARSRMSATELKAFYQITTLVKMTDDDFNEFAIDINTFAKELGINTTNREYIRELCRGLAKQLFEIDNKETLDFDVYTIFRSFKYRHKEGKIYVRFNDQMKPFLLNLKRYTHIQQVKYIKSFESKYSIRIYTLLKDYRLLSHRDITIEALTKIFKLPKSYENYSNLFNRVLKSAMDEINELSDIYITKIEPIEKQRKKVLKIRIYFQNKADTMANDVINYLKLLYKNSNNDPTIFEGKNYASEGTEHIVKIASIEVEPDRPYYKAIYQDPYGNRTVIFSMFGKVNFMKALYQGITNALVLQFEKEKKISLDLDAWQSKKDRLAKIQSLFQGQK